MAFLANNVFDQGLNYLDVNGTRIDICSQEPVTYAAATATYSLGNSATTTGAPADRVGGGREVTVAAVSGAAVSATGTATHWALTNGTAELLATGTLSASQAVTSGNTFDLAAFTIGIPDPA